MLVDALRAYAQGPLNHLSSVASYDFANRAEIPSEFPGGDRRHHTNWPGIYGCHKWTLDDGARQMVTVYPRYPHGRGSFPVPLVQARPMP